MIAPMRMIMAVVGMIIVRMVMRVVVGGVRVGHHAGRYALANQNAIEYNGMI